MFLTLKRNWQVIDFLKPRNQLPHIVEIPPGRHEFERIPNPHGHPGNVLVLKGTLIGASEGSWRQWAPGSICEREGNPNFGKPTDWGDFAVVIEE